MPTRSKISTRTAITATRRITKRTPIGSRWRWASHPAALSAEECAQIHIPRSVQIPLGELESRLSEIPRDQDLVVVCLSGKRSKEGMTILQNAGFKRASCLSGGISDWKAAGYPFEEAISWDGAHQQETY